MVESEYRSALARLDVLRADPNKGEKTEQEAELLTFLVHLYEARHMGGPAPSEEDVEAYVRLLRRLLGGGGGGGGTGGGGNSEGSGEAQEGRDG